MLVLLAFWDSRKHVTTIAPFQVPKADLPFTGEMVSDALQDGLESMHNEIEVAKVGSGLQSYETGCPTCGICISQAFSIYKSPRGLRLR
jgi:hypothetical protein